MHKFLKSALIGSTALAIVSPAAFARDFNIPRGDLKIALDAYMKQAGIALMYPPDSVAGVRSPGAHGELPAEVALSKILAGTGFSTERTPTGAIGIVREEPLRVPARELADAAPVHASASVETVVVTSSKIKGDIQTVPIAITALSQQQLTERQIAGGPDLVKEVPNLTFSKTNFTGYNIEIRGIGTQAISVTTDPAVAVAFNDTPFIRNHFFEQEFYDVAQVEVLRGPQGTLYGRNATAGVVNVVSAKPTDRFEAMLSADWGNYHNRRYEGMVNLPIVGEKLALRIAGEWTKRDGYSFNSLTNAPIDGRDLWSSRATLRWKPVEGVTADFIWEHFSENDDRLRSAKQLCKRDNGPATVLGVSTAKGSDGQIGVEYLGQGCLPTSMYSPDAYGVPNSLSLPYYGGFIGAGFGEAVGNPLVDGFSGLRDAYASTTQSHNLRVIESTLNPTYKAKNDTLELNAEWAMTPALTVNSATGYNADFLWSTEDFNRFNTQPGIFSSTNLYGTPGSSNELITPDGNYRCSDGYLAMGETCAAAGHDGGYGHPDGIPTGYFCDPQLGCSNRLVGEDLSEEHSWQFSQEVRLSSNFQGPFNFSAGGNYLHYETEENYYVFFNTITMYAAVDGLNGRDPNIPWVPGVSYNAKCVPNGRQLTDPNQPTNPEDCLGYIDPNPITSLDNQGHNYFLSQNPYVLNSYALFGEAYYDITKDLKFTGGLRWTDDQKHFVEIPSELLTLDYGYPVTGELDQQWKEWTGRAVFNWTPKLDFTDQTMFYASYAHGYKAGGANPPGTILLSFRGGDITNPTHPKTFAPEFNDAFELGTKNTALDGDLTLNGNVFYYNYKGYQISEIVDRTAINLNFNATVKGAEIQATYSPLPGLKFAFAGGYEDARLANGSKAVDLMDRTAGNPNWVVVKPFVTQASNCVLPAYVIAADLSLTNYAGNDIPSACGEAYNAGHDPLTYQTYTAYPTYLSNNNTVPTYPGFDPLAGNDPNDPYTGQNTYNGIDYGPAPNNGTGFYKNVSGKNLPNAPHYTVSLTADYTMPVSADWAATLHGDFYWQSQSWARVFNAVNDKIRGYSSVNTALILTDASGWQVMGYVKNIFNVTAITGTFLNSDDTGLTTNVFLTDPRLYGVRITKNFDGGSDGKFDLFGSGNPQIWLTVGGNFAWLNDKWQHYVPPFEGSIPADLPSPLSVEKSPGTGFDWEGQLSYQPDQSDWVLKGGIRYGRSHSYSSRLHAEGQFSPVKVDIHENPYCKYYGIHCTGTAYPNVNEVVDAIANSSEKHTMLDFTIGKDIGKLLGTQGTAGIGVRVAQFMTRAKADIDTNPNFFATFTPPFYKYLQHDVLDGISREKRTFHGIGPQITWDASNAIYGTAESGQVTIDWGVNAALLFGQQNVDLNRTLSDRHCKGETTFQERCVEDITTESITRSKNVTVPNLGGYAGLSVRYNSAKISLGYRADEFFNAMDGGQATAKKYNRGFYGPYLNLSIGFGG